MSELALARCPFCGGEASPTGSVRYSENHDAWWSDGTRVQEAFFVNCMACSVDNKGLLGHQTQEAAITAWNRRAPNPSPPEPSAGWRGNSSSQSLPCDRRADALSVGLDAERAAAFTPAPWVAEASGVVGFGGPVIRTGPGTHVAWLTRGQAGDGWPNAYLIAAAPDQHAALDDAEVALTALINRYGYEDDNTTPKDWNEWVFARAARDAARAAVAKALGREAARPTGDCDEVPGS